MSDQSSGETERATEQVEKGANNDRSPTPDERSGKKDEEGD